MPLIHVDVDFNEFSSDDLIEELIERNSKDSWKRLKPEDMYKLEKGLSLKESICLPQKTIEDIAKAEIIRDAWDKYTSSQLESLLK